MKTTTTIAAARLYWSERGETACSAHAPYKGSDTWRWGRWKQIKPAEAREFARELGHAPQCETCAAMERNAKERS